MEKAKKRFHSKSRNFMGWLIKNNGSLFGDSLYCRLCLLREKQRENPSYSQQDLGRSRQPCCTVAIASQ